MFGIFIPIHAGHLPIDLHQKKIYNCINKNNETPLHLEKGLLPLCGEEPVPQRSERDLCAPRPQAERGYGIRTYIPLVGTGGNLNYHPAERVGALSAERKVLTAFRLSIC